LGRIQSVATRQGDEATQVLLTQRQSCLCCKFKIGMAYGGHRDPANGDLAHALSDADSACVAGILLDMHLYLTFLAISAIF
jgi:hypothetical protein